MAHTITLLDDDISTLRRDGENRHREILRGLINKETVDKIASQMDKLDRIERTVDSFHEQFSSLQGAMRESHRSLTEGLPVHMSNSKSNARS